MPSVISGDANVSATEFGFLDGVTSSLQTQIDSKLNLAGGKILQIVRATDGTQRTTTSTSFVDVSGVAVTITPQKSDSAIIVVAIGQARATIAGGGQRSNLILTDSSNNTLSGANSQQYGVLNAERVIGSTMTFRMPFILWGYVTPATTSAVTYKMRFRSEDSSSQTTGIEGAENTTNIYAIEVSA